MPWLLLLITFPLLFVVSLLYSSNIGYGILSIEKRISLFLMPLVFSTVPGWDKERTDKFFFCAYLSALLAAVVCLGIAAYSFFSLGQNTFFWSALTRPLAFHPGYFSFFIAVPMLWLIHDLISTWNTRPVWFRIAAVSSAVFLSLFLILLASRVQLFLFYLTVILLFLWRWKKLSKGQLIFMLVFLAISAFVIANTFIKDRINNISSITYKLDDPTEKFNELTIRLALIECSWEVIRENWAVGVGAGDSYDELEKVYYQKNYKYGYSDHQDPHNEYLNTLVSLGLPGLGLLLATFALSLYLGWKRSDPVHVSFILIFAVSCLLESMLSQQKGIVLFSLFNSMLVFKESGANTANQRH